MTEEKILESKLGDLIDGDFDTFLSKVKKDILKYGSFFKKMRPDMAESDFKSYLEFDGGIDENFNRLYAYADMMVMSDQDSDVAKLYYGKAYDLEVDIEKAKINVDFWLMGKEVKGKEVLDDKNAKRLFNSDPKLTYHLNQLRDSSKHKLTIPEENLSSQKDADLLSRISTLRDTLTTDFTFFLKPHNQRGKTINTESKITSLWYSQDSAVREAAYRSVLGMYKKNHKLLFTMYESIVKNWIHDAEQRNFPTSISKRNYSNKISDDIVDTILNVCTENRDIYQNFFEWKASQLGVKKLKRFDIYAPMHSEDVNIPFSQSLDLVLDVFGQFSPTFLANAKRIIDAEHMDSHPRPTKSSGAFACPISPNMVPYVSLNHMGRSRDIMIMAHELGHGVHFLYAENQSQLAYEAPLTLSETASTLAENMVFEMLFEKAGNDNIRKTMLAGRLADSYATVMRQSYLVQFERKAHEAFVEGITPDELCDTYFKTLQEQFGDSLDIDPIFSYEWAYIPHIFHTPFYCYSYSFGDLLSPALFAMYKEEGKSFVPKIEKILSYGGSKDSEAIFKEVVGIDMTDKKFWQGGFDIIKDWQKQLESFD